MKLSNDVLSTNHKVWDVLMASHRGDLMRVKELVAECSELAYAQYNYTPPIYFAVREGHLDLVKYLLGLGAHDPSYKIYPFQESLNTIASDRNYEEIAQLLTEYSSEPTRVKFKGDNGEILYERSAEQREFEVTVDKELLNETEAILKKHPEFVEDTTYFWGEGILMMPAKENNRELVELLMRYGARVPMITKWCQFYYFKKYEMAAFLLEKGMNPNHMSWHQVTILHDMAQKGDIAKAELLIKYGAELNSIDEEYLSTPLGMAARWGHIEMVEYLLQQGADPNKAGAVWSSPLQWARKKGYPEIEAILKQARAV